LTEPPPPFFPLIPGDAVAAIILVGDRYLLQHRDAKPDIFFPDYWGCFGGGIDADESDPAALLRELSEELGFSADGNKCVPFTRFDFDFGFAGCDVIYRQFYELHLPEGALDGLKLGEGQAMGLFDGDMLMNGSLRLTPYDEFALWMHLNQARLQPAPTTP
jgi:8-oxo-dGTP pyrophosphatase MutT (NUDIX family)